MLTKDTISTAHDLAESVVRYFGGRNAPEPEQENDRRLFALAKALLDADEPATTIEAAAALTFEPWSREDIDAHVAGGTYLPTLLVAQRFLGMTKEQLVEAVAEIDRNGTLEPMWRAMLSAADYSRHFATVTQVAHLRFLAAAATYAQRTRSKGLRADALAAAA